MSNWFDVSILIILSSSFCLSICMANFLMSFIFKINEIRKIQVEIDRNKVLDKMIIIETSKQLDKFSNIFYNKIKLNSKISEF